MELISGKDKFYSIIKYDHEQVLTYSLQGGTTAILEEITNSFTKSKESLHKSALIKLTQTGGELIVIDKTVQYDITKFFRGFLNVRRKYTESEMTQVLQNVTTKTTQKHLKELPREITGRVREISYKAVQSSDFFEADEYFLKVFGSYGNEKIKKTFHTLLNKNDIEDETFRFDKTVVEKPKKRKYRTQEGVRIQYGEEAKDTVDIRYGKGDEDTIITIKTQKLTEE